MNRTVKGLRNLIKLADKEIKEWTKFRESLKRRIEEIKPKKAKD